MKISMIPALKTNYFWLVQPNRQRAEAYIFDPGDEPPVTRALQTLGLNLAGIIITHHHWDHTDGIAALLARFNVPVYGPDSERIPSITQPLNSGDTLNLPDFALQVLATPGHTLDHIAYVHTDETGLTHLFSADNIFGAGCGRRFEGSAEVYYRSLRKLAELPPTTLIYCSHEYTLDNIRFALQVEPDNQALQERQPDRHRTCFS
ncbi:MAG TPA: hydroxyacylglutathione hydrolase [Cellvibrionaceae bacterium]